MSYYIHNVPGRLRIKTPAVKKNQNAADNIRKMLGTINGIAVVEINILTGSILVNYNPAAVHFNDIVNLLQKKGYFDASQALTNDEYIHKASSRIGSIVGKAVFGAVVEKGLEGSALSFLFALI